MFFLVILIILYLILFLFGTVGFGKLLHSLLFKKDKTSNLGEYGLLGLVFISLVSTFIHFFFNLSQNINLIVYFLGLLFSYNNKVEIQIFLKKNKNFISLLFITSFFMVIYHKPNEDFGYYHLPYLVNIVSEKVIFGLATIQTNQGWNSIWLNLTGTYNLPIIEMKGVHLTNAVFFIFFSLAISEPIINYKNKIKISTHVHIKYLIELFSSLFFLYFVLKFSRLGKYGFDIPSNFMAIYCFYLFLKFFSLKSGLSYIKNNIFQKIIIFCFFSILIKLSNILILLLPAFIFLKKEIKFFSRSLFFVIFLIITWMIQQFIYTGCFLFPLIHSCFDVSWFNINPVLDLLNHTKGINKSFAQYQGELSEVEYSKNFNWVSTWLNRNLIEILEHILTYVIIFFFLFLCLSKKKISSKSFLLKNFFYILLSIIFFQIMFWFNASPVIRFGFHYIILFLFFLMYLIFNKFLLKNLNYKHAIFLIYLGLTLNIQKNLLRIYDDINKGNTFFYTYPKIFFKNEYIADQKINVNYLIKDYSIYCWDIPSLCLAGNQNLVINRVNGYLFIFEK
jgi:hypothetical protein